MNAGIRVARLASRLAAVFAAAALAGGCAALGLHVPKPVETVENESVSIPPGTYLSDVICRAAGARKWSPTVISDRLVRCRYVARSWTITVDVHHNNRDTFSVRHVDSTGLFYDASRGTIHGTYNKMVRALCQQIRNEAYMAPRLAHAPAASPAVAHAQSAVPAAASAPQPEAARPGYTIASFVRESGDDVAYSFAIDLADAGSADFDTSARIQEDIREAVRRECVSSSAADPSSVRIAFPEYRMSGGRIEGRAVVLKVELLELVYNDETRQGRLSVRVNPSQYEMARQWVRDNIDSLARDKKVGSGRSGGFRIGSEMLHDGNILEVEFY